MNRWLLGARPRTLPAAVVPVAIGASAATGDGEVVWWRVVAALVVALALQVGVNFANDYSDAARGADTLDRIGPTRAVATGLISPSEMKTGIVVVFGLAVVLGAYLALIAGWVILVIGVLSIVAALAYTGGPFPYGYRALGEVFVFVFFGLVATVGTRYVYDQTWPLDAWIGGLTMGCLSTAILLANNIRDVGTDAIAGKRTLAVRIGRGAAQRLFTAIVAAAFVITAIGSAAAAIPRWSALALLAAPMAVPIVRTVEREQSGPRLIAALKATARLQIVFGVLFAAGALV